MEITRAGQTHPFPWLNPSPPSFSGCSSGAGSLLITSLHSFWAQAQLMAPGAEPQGDLRASRACVSRLAREMLCSPLHFLVGFFYYILHFWAWDRSCVKSTNSVVCPYMWNSRLRFPTSVPWAHLRYLYCVCTCVLMQVSDFPGNLLWIYTSVNFFNTSLTQEACRIQQVFFITQDWISLFLQEQEWFSWNENVHSTAPLATGNLQLKPSPFFMLKL